MDRLSSRRSVCVLGDFLAAFSSRFYSQVLTMSLPRISSLCNFLRDLQQRRPHLAPELSKGLSFANRNAHSRVPAVTTYPNFPVCMQLVASRVVASSRLNINLYGSYFAAGMAGMLYSNIISTLFIKADVLLQSPTATAHHRLRVLLAA